MSYISEEEFTVCCEEFLAASQDLGDSWARGGVAPHGLYLVKRVVRVGARHGLPTPPAAETGSGAPSAACVQATAPQRPADAGCRKGSSCSQLQVPFSHGNQVNGPNIEPDDCFSELGADSSADVSVDDPSEFKLDHRATEATVTFEYNVVYSLCHSVPMLTFEAYWPNGKPLTLEEAWSNVVDANFMGQIYAKRWESLTMVEHPVKGSPCFVLHPCRTAQLMAQVESIAADSPPAHQGLLPCGGDACVRTLRSGSARVEGGPRLADAAAESFAAETPHSSSGRDSAAAAGTPHSNSGRESAARAPCDTRAARRDAGLWGARDHAEAPAGCRHAQGSKTGSWGSAVRAERLHKPQDALDHAPAPQDPVPPRARAAEGGLQGAAADDGMLAEGGAVNRLSAEGCEGRPAEGGAAHHRGARTGQLRGGKYLISWLSMMGPVVGLRLDLRYFALE